MKTIKKRHITKFEGLDVEIASQNILPYVNKFINRLLNKVGINVSRHRGNIDYSSEFFSYHTNDKLNNYRAQKIKEALSPLNALSKYFKDDSIICFIDEYFELIKDSPVKIDGGGLGVLNGLKLFISVKILKPTIIIESGVWRGFTSYIFNHASSIDTKIYSYDINLDNLIYKGSKKVKFIESDWFEETKKIKLKIDSTLCFFDDHVSHVQRINEASQLGIKHIIFDDNYSLEQIYIDGWPPIPTVDMCFDEISREITNISWIKNGQAYHGKWNAKDLVKCRNLIQKKIDYPSLYNECGYQPGSKMSYVKLN